VTRKFTDTCLLAVSLLLTDDQRFGKTPMFVLVIERATIYETGTRNSTDGPRKKWLKAGSGMED
jgi:hypothetical protein